MQRSTAISPQDSDTFKPTAISAAYGIAIPDRYLDMKQQGSSEQQDPFNPHMAHPASSAPGLQPRVQPMHQPENPGVHVASRGSLRRAGDSFTFSGGSADVEHQQYEAAQVFDALHHGTPVSTLHEPAPHRVITLSEGENLDGAALHSEPMLLPAAYTDMLQGGSALRMQPVLQEDPPGGQEAEGHASQAGRRVSNMSSNGTSRGGAQAQGEADMRHVLQSPSHALDGMQRPARQDDAEAVVPEDSRLEQDHQQQQQQYYPKGRVYSNMAWSPRLRVSSAVDDKDLSSNSSLPGGNMTARQTGEPATWRGRSTPPVPPRSPADECMERGRVPEGHETWDAEWQQGAPPPEEFKVYDNQVAASAHAADQLLHSAAAHQASQVGLTCILCTRNTTCQVVLVHAGLDI